MAKNDNFDAIFHNGEHYINEHRKINDMKIKSVFLMMLMLAVASMLLISCDKETIDGKDGMQELWHILDQWH